MRQPLSGREQYGAFFSKDGNAAARQLYETTIALDPNYAAPYAALAETYLHDWFAGDPEALDRASELAETAKRLDPSLAAGLRSARLGPSFQAATRGGPRGR